MDTLQVQCLQSQKRGGGGSKSPSRSSSPCRSDPMSKDRDSSACSGQTDLSSSGSTALRLRHLQQSPSTNRRSRERERERADTNKPSDRDTDSNTMLIMSNDRDMMMAVDHLDSFDESRLSGGDEMSYQYQHNIMNDDMDGNSSTHLIQSEGRHHHQRTNSFQALDRLNTKMECTKESIRKEQNARDENVKEYLSLASNADKQQLQHIKAVFEKKNQKSAHTISQLQKKLEAYNKRIKDFNTQQSQRSQSHRQPREMLRDVGQGLRNVGGNIRDGISGLSGSVMAKPREFAHLIKNKFGSADHINQLSSNPELDTLNLSTHKTMDVGSVTLTGMASSTMGTSTPNNTGTLASVGSNSNAAAAGVTSGGGGSGKFNSENDSECSSVTSDSLPAGSGKIQHGHSHNLPIVKEILAELKERRHDYEKLREKVDRLENLQKEVSDLALGLESERYRAEQLEEQINDLTELHQNEIENLKQTMADMEEKVQYQSDERLRDVNEVLENCQTRITKMEHMSQQQYVTVEGIDNSNARALVVKLINVVLTVLQVILLLVATAAGIIMPFLKTRVRVLTTVFFIFITICVIRQWPDVRDIGSHMVRHLKDSLVVK